MGWKEYGTEVREYEIQKTAYWKTGLKKEKEGVKSYLGSTKTAE